MNEFGEKIDHACSLKIIVLSRDEIVAGPTGERKSVMDMGVVSSHVMISFLSKKSGKLLRVRVVWALLSGSREFRRYDIGLENHQQI